MVAYLNNGLQDVYDLGFTARAFVVVPRPLDVRQGDYLDAATGTFSMIGHGYTADDLVRFVQTAAGSLPFGANLLRTYVPIPIDYWTFGLAESSGGQRLTFAEAGSGWALQLDPERRLMRIAENVSRDIDQDLTAHATPIQRDPNTNRFPDKLVGVTVRETARRGVAGLTFENPQFRTAKERVDALQKTDDEQRAAWALGQPISPRPIDQTAAADNAVRATNGVAAGCVAPMPWLTGTL